MTLVYGPRFCRETDQQDVRGCYCKALAHRIMEAEKPTMGSRTTSWRPRKAHDVIKSEYEELRTREASYVNPNLKAGDDERGCLNSRREAGKNWQILPSSTVCSVQVLSGLDGAHPHQGGRSGTLH